MTDTRSDYIVRATEELASLEARIAELRGAADARATDTRQAMTVNLAGIEELRNQATLQIDEVRLTSSPGLGNVRRGLEQTMRALSDAIDDLSDQVKATDQ